MMTQQEADELAALREEVKTLRKKLAASSNDDDNNHNNNNDSDDDVDTKPPAAKKTKVSSKIWVIVKGGPSPDMIGAYSSEEKANAALDKFIKKMGWDEDYEPMDMSREEIADIISYEKNIEIIARSIDGPPTLL